MFFKKKKERIETPEEILTAIKKLRAEVKSLKNDLDQEKKESKKSLQKIGMVRFNPFSGTGGDQSFSLAVLDDNDDGFIITSFYTSNSSSVYAKPIENGKSPYNLSQEEERAIEMAINKEEFFKRIDSKKKK